MSETPNLEQMDPEYPYGSPEELDYSKLDASGRELIHEVNLRPWMASTEYCSGHPTNRPDDEFTAWGNTRGDERWDFGLRERELQSRHFKGAITDNEYALLHADLRLRATTRFYLNVNVFDIDLFWQWMVTTQSLLSAADPYGAFLEIRANPWRPGYNFSILYPYTTIKEREWFHRVILEALQSVVV